MASRDKTVVLIGGAFEKHTDLQEPILYAVQFDSPLQVVDRVNLNSSGEVDERQQCGVTCLRRLSYEEDLLAVGVVKDVYIVAWNSNKFAVLKAIRDVQPGIIDDIWVRNSREVYCVCEDEEQYVQLKLSY